MKNLKLGLFLKSTPAYLGLGKKFKEFIFFLGYKLCLVERVSLRKGSKRKSFLVGKDCSGEPGRLQKGLWSELRFDAPKNGFIFIFL
ncbi:hypothetical protein EHQ49_18475 [Leptospira perdikensis]|uniref:Uncharacterized protein n=1 Tax=Leptospira perdikensis TaxID=2484948 RepID=A0A4R9J4Y7_9LEPT|nr:hypothetical protein EHQ49_18475 [Leptospira perdikensis]